MNKSNTEAVSNYLIKKLKIKVNESSIDKCLKKHPDYPSLLSISNCLTDWKIDNHSFRADKNSYKEDLLFPFIAHLPEDDGHFLLVNSCKDGRIYYSDESNEFGSIPEKEFVTRWDGIALHAESSYKSGEYNYKQNRIQQILNSLLLPGSLLILVAALYLCLVEQGYNLPVLFLSVVKLVGISVCVLLLIQSLNASNPFLKNLCSIIGRSDCNAVLNSTAANLTSWLSWSEVGFFYFTGSFISLIIFPQSVYLLVWINLIALPYTFYSIGYQIINKNFCVLCCAIQLMLWVEFLLNLLSFGFHIPLITFNLLIDLFFSFGCVIISWAYLKPYFLRANQSSSFEKHLNIFKYNSDIFDQLLSKQPRFAIGKELMPIILGDPSAKTIITMVSGPFCGPCGKAHGVLSNLLRYNEDVQIKILFYTVNESNDLGTKVAKHLGALSRLEDKAMASRALEEWYSSAVKDYKFLASNFPVVIDEIAEVVTKNQKDWCEMADITVTPTVFINGHKLPPIYDLEDIRYLLN